MTFVEEKLIDVGNRLAVSLGHKPGCPKIAPALPCQCGEGQYQAAALAAWLQLIDSIKES